MAKIALTEEKLRRIVENATRDALNEISYQTAYSAYRKAGDKLSGREGGYRDPFEREKLKGQRDTFYNNFAQKFTDNGGLSAERAKEIDSLMERLRTNESSNINQVASEMGIQAPTRQEINRYRKMRTQMIDLENGDQAYDKYTGTWGRKTKEKNPNTGHYEDTIDHNFYK